MSFNRFYMKSNLSKNQFYNISVKTIDAELNFSLEIKSKGRELFELVCRALGLREVWYFGLLFTDINNNKIWLKMNKKILKQYPGKDKNLFFEFLVKFYPEDVSEEIIQSVTRHALFLQVKQAILNTEIYCPPEATVLLASYAIQAKFGDYSEEILRSDVLLTKELLPQRVVDQFQMTADMWMDQILEWYIKIRGMEREEAETEYLKIAQDLEMYCVQYFKIKNNQNTNLWLGITNHGLNIYEHDNKLLPKVSFQWKEIKGLYYKDKKFIVNLIDKKSPKFVCFVDREKTCKTIMDLCIGNHELFLRRRGPDTIEVQQMKIQAKDEKLKKLADRKKLHYEKEIILRMKRDQVNTNLEHHEKFQELQKQLSDCQEALTLSEEAADLLAEKVNLAEKEVYLLTRKATEALNEKSILQLAALKTEEEKLMIEKQLKEAQIIANKKSQEADSLKYELLETRKAETELRRKYTSIIQSHVFNGVSHSSSMLPTIESSEISNQDLFFQSSNNLQNENDRIDHSSKLQNIDVRLIELKKEIFQTKNNIDNPMDNIYDQTHQQGDNKYSTLEKVRGGTAKSRVHVYENL